MEKVFKTIIYKETGSRHIRKLKECEDNVYSYSSSKGVVSIALSDGAGAYQYAKEGSLIVSRKAAEFMAENFDELYILDKKMIDNIVTGEVLAGIKEKAESQGQDIMEFSATLLCVAWHPDGRYIMVHVGDGAIVGLTTENEVKVISLYEHDGAVNLTSFVTNPDGRTFVNKGDGTEYVSFALMSDGPEEFLVNEKGAGTHVRMMQQMNFFLETKDMTDQMNSLNNLLKDIGMEDDSSFAIISDLSKIGTVFEGLPSVFRQRLWDLDKDFSKKQLKRIKKTLNLVAGGSGITLKSLARKLYLHSKRITKKRINELLDMELVRQENNRIYISD